MAAQETDIHKLIEKFIDDVQVTEKLHGLQIGVDDVNPFELVLRNNKGKIVAWLGTSTVEWDAARIDITTL